MGEKRGDELLLPRLLNPNRISTRDKGREATMQVVEELAGIVCECALCVSIATFSLAPGEVMAPRERNASVAAPHQMGSKIFTCPAV